MPISAANQCHLSVPPISASQCCLSVRISAPISACQCRLSVPVSAAYQCQSSVLPISAAYQRHVSVLPFSAHQ
ncbi:unnamed protein product [Staurois parvus]|uniref:Uncharacterized protein n=1 Tax=Staurois parvus TaxID=386267 RepID=A0ABN9FH83_9NEOB|nr:unnamed protein product [Staurois parvus]